jgi:chemotaxis protein MotA
MDPTSLLAIFAALGLVLWSAGSAASLSSYFDVSALAVVIGGTLCVVVARSSLTEFIGSLRMVVQSFSLLPEKPEQTVEQFVDFATLARRDGLLALDKQDVRDAFFRRGLNMLIDGADEDKLRVILMRDIENTETQHVAFIDIWQTWVDVGPAMGMVGTLVGLVAMLGNMTDPKSIGPAMAVAILTTLYGALVANVIGLPIVTKLRAYAIADVQHSMLVLEGLCAIARGETARHMRDYLTPMIPKKSLQLSQAEAF